MSVDIDGAIRAAAAEAFGEIDDATFWLYEKTSTTTGYGRNEAYPSSVDEEDGLACHMTELTKETTARFSEKIGTKKGYSLFFAIDGPELPEGSVVLVRSGGDPIAYQVIGGTSDAPTDTGLRTVRKRAVIVRLEKQPSVTVSP